MATGHLVMVCVVMLSFPLTVRSLTDEVNLLQLHTKDFVTNLHGDNPDESLEVDGDGNGEQDSEDDNDQGDKDIEEVDGDGNGEQGSEDDNDQEDKEVDVDGDGETDSEDDDGQEDGDAQEAVELRGTQGHINDLSSHQNETVPLFSGMISPPPPKQDTLACFFVRVAVAQVPREFEQWEAVASTWALHPADGTRVYYLIDYPISENRKLPNNVTAEQLISTPPTQYFDIISKDNFTFHEVFNSTRIRDQCKWIALTETDAYVNAGLVAQRLKQFDHGQLHMMGNTMYGFVHGCFRIFSSAAIAPITASLQNCRLQKGYSDAQLAKCIAASGLSATLKAEEFGKVIIDDHGTAEIFGRIGAEIAKTSCNDIDVVHKMTPQLMMVHHKLTSQLPDCPTRRL